MAKNLTLTDEAHRALALFKFKNGHRTYSDAVLEATRAEATE